MNFKTTIGLGIAVVVLSAIYLIIGVDQTAQSRDAAGDDGAPSSTSNAAGTFLVEPLLSC